MTKETKYFKLKEPYPFTVLTHNDSIMVSVPADEVIKIEAKKDDEGKWVGADVYIKHADTKEWYLTIDYAHKHLMEKLEEVDDPDI